MQKVGFVGIGKIGLPICANLIKSGYAVVGYRRSSLAEFEALGGIAARSPAEVTAQTDIVFTCLPDAAALEEVMRGPHGLVASARNNQVVVELGSHPLSVKQRYIALLADKGVVFLDGEVSGTPGMVAQRKGVIYLGGPAAAVTRVEPIVAGFADLCMHLGAFGSATKVKLVNNLLVALHIAGTAQAMAIGLKTGGRPRTPDQGGRARQRRLHAIRHSRAVDGRTPLHAATGRGGGARSLPRGMQSAGPRGRSSDAAARLPG
jgi:3-hydroxyisobutyrate dehydrogenase-like beta-hydroxyacid dehydrogenase